MENEGFLEGNGIIILILFFLMMGGGGLWGNNMNRGEYATSQQVYETANATGVNAKLDTMNQAINNATFQNMQNTANVTQTLNSGFDGINANIAQLGYQMSSCCCDIKQTLLNNKIEELQRDLQNASNIISNQTQSQYILSQLGKFTPYAYLNGTTVV